MAGTDGQKVILVTGGAGFIGSNLIEALLRDPRNRVISLDNYFSGSRENHIAEAEYIEGHTKDIGSLVTERPDIVYHLGEYARTSASFEDVSRVWDLNSAGTFAVLEFCRANRSKLVYAGSSTKFGDGGLGRDQSPYAWAKATNTELVANYGTWFNLEHAITYFYNVYGPRENADPKYGTLIAIWLEKARRSEPLAVVSPGTQRRNFTHVADIVSGLILIGEQGHGDGYGLGAPESYTLTEVAEMFSVPYEMLPPRPGDRMDSALDTSKSEHLGWRAEHRLEKYIQAALRDSAAVAR